MGRLEAEYRELLELRERVREAEAMVAEQPKGIVPGNLRYMRSVPH
jgi:hypothetical protein